MFDYNITNKIAQNKYKNMIKKLIMIHQVILILIHLIIY